MKRWRWLLCAILMMPLRVMPLRAQAPAKPDPFAGLGFLQGTWDAKGSGQGGATANGTYSFRLELGGNVLARHTTSQDSCKGPATFDCEHGDLLYVYPEGPGLKAIYFDNEGHTLHYDVTTRDAGTAVFLSDASVPGPQFRLIYVLKGGVMSGKFQMRMPGGAEWRSYLEWSGGKKG